MTKKQKEVIEFQNYFANIAPNDLGDIMEVLHDKEMLNEKGKDFFNAYWELFIKGNVV